MAGERGKLTDLQIRHWVKAGVPLAKADGGGLTFTLSAGGSAGWILRYSFGGRRRELTIGRYPDIGLAEARGIATLKRAEVQQGRNPAAEKHKPRPPPRATGQCVTWPIAAIGAQLDIRRRPAAPAS